MGVPFLVCIIIMYTFVWFYNLHENKFLADSPHPLRVGSCQLNPKLDNYLLEAYGEIDKQPELSQNNSLRHHWALLCLARDDIVHFHVQAPSQSPTQGDKRWQCCGEGWSGKEFVGGFKTEIY